MTKGGKVIVVKRRATYNDLKKKMTYIVIKNKKYALYLLYLSDSDKVSD